MLFDLGLAARLTPMQRLAYRLVVASGEFDLPYSRRITLQRELGRRLLDDARARGEPRETIRKRILRSEDPEYTAGIVVKALREMAVSPKELKELEAARREIERLREELVQLRRSGRSASPLRQGPARSGAGNRRRGKKKKKK